MCAALKIVYGCISKKHGNRALSTLAYLLFGDLFGNTLRNIHMMHQVEALNTEGMRFLDTMASILSKLSLNESFAGGSSVYHMNGWIQSRYEGFEKSMCKLLSVDAPTFAPWNSGCVVEGPVQNMHILLHTLFEHKEEIHRSCMAQVWSMQSSLSSYQSRIPILWAALEGTRRRGNPDHMPSHSTQASPDKESHSRTEGTEETLSSGLLGQMTKMVGQTNRSGGKGPKLDSRKNRMEHLSATVTDMDLSSRDLLTVPKLDHFKNLRVLHVSQNRLHKLANLPISLCTLDCSHNQLSNLDSLRGFANLEILNASHNLLQEIGPDNCSRIMSLDISHNRLSTSIDCLRMPELCDLLIDHNMLKSVQDLRLLAHNTNLRSMTLEGNPLCKEAGYLADIAVMLPPSLCSIDGVSIVSAQYHRLSLDEPTQSPFLPSRVNVDPSVSPLL